MSKSCEMCNSVHCQDYQDQTRALEAENKRIKELDRTHRKLLKDHVGINELLMAENKTLKEEKAEIRETLDELIKSLKEVESSGFLPDGDSINLSTKMWLERLIQKAHPKEKGG